MVAWAVCRVRAALTRNSRLVRRLALDSETPRPNRVAFHDGLASATKRVRLPLPFDCHRGERSERLKHFKNAVNRYEPDSTSIVATVIVFLGKMECTISVANLHKG